MPTYAWTTPDISYTNGTVLGAGDINTINNNIGYLSQNQIGNPAGSIIQTVGQASMPAGNTQIINMSASGTGAFLNGGVTLVSNGLTVPVAGFYLVNWQIVWGTPPAGGAQYIEANVGINGVAATFGTLSTLPASQTYWNLVGSRIVQLNAGDNLILNQQCNVAGLSTRVAQPSQVSNLAVSLVSS